MTKVLIVNANEKEYDNWAEQLVGAGYGVMPECRDLSTMAHLLAQNEVDIAICSMALIGDNAVQILKTCTHVFPRLRIVLVGYMVNSEILLRLSNVVIRSKFGVDLDKYFSHPAPSKADIKRTIEQLMHLILNENYLSMADATELLSKLHPDWSSEYVVICVTSNNDGYEVFNIIESLAYELNLKSVIQTGLNEVSIILDNSPTQDEAVIIGQKLQSSLLSGTTAMFSIGISRAREWADELYVCKNEALRAASASYLYGKNSVIHITYIDSHSIVYAYPEHKERRLIELIMDGDKLGSLVMLESIFEVLRRLPGLPQDVVCKISQRLMLGLSIAATSQSEIYEKMIVEKLPRENLLNAKSIDETYECLKELIVYFSAQMQSVRERRMDEIYAELVDIKIKRAGQEISVLDVTREVHATLSFLNSAIKRNSKSNLFEFFGEL